MKERFCDNCYCRLASVFSLITFKAKCLDCYLDQHFALAIGETKMSKFQAKVENNYLSVTHNGKNWSSIRLDHRQMEAVRELLAKELQSYVKKMIHEREESGEGVGRP